MSTRQKVVARRTPSAQKPYQSPLRQQQVAATRDLILAAGADLVRGFPSWDWRDLTFRAVSERAGVSQRTVLRHFANERVLRDALINRLTEESGVTLEGLEFHSLAPVLQRTFSYLSSFAAAPEAGDPSFASHDQRRRDALLNAAVTATPGWPARHQQQFAAALDMVSNVPHYERLVAAWSLPPDRAFEVVDWMLQLMERAVAEDFRPGPRSKRGPAKQQDAKAAAPRRKHAG